MCVDHNADIQGVLGSRVEESPFAQVLLSAKTKETLVVYNPAIGLETRIWCCYEIYLAIKYDDHNKLGDMGAKSEINFNFMIEVEPGKMYHPLIIASILGHVDCLKCILQNQTIDINTIDKETGCNAFWFSA